ncbi:MAG: glycerol kinase GlpK [Christensenellales bacterium]
MKKFILALDQGTTSSRAIVFDSNGAMVSVAQKEFTQYYPNAGWVEHDPKEILHTQESAAIEAVQSAGISPSEIAAIGITNQRETTVVWDKETGKPVCNAIVWQCRRTAQECEELKKRGLGEMVRQRTGLVIDAYFSATKLQWILRHVPGAMEKAKRGQLLFGTVDTWLLWNLTAGKVHATDVTNASRTMLFNIHTISWDAGLVKELGIPVSMLPQVLPSSHVFGTTELLGTPIPIGGIAGDQQAALFGQACFEEGAAKNTYGTGCFILMNTGGKPVVSKNNLLTTIAWGISGKITYALEGSVFNAGTAVQWLRDSLGLIKTASETESAALSVADTNGVHFIPAFTGLGAPYWDMYARGTITGITRGTKREHMIRAALESIAFQSKDVLCAMENDACLKLKELKVDGGASVNNMLMQFQSDILDTVVLRPEIFETTALGAAYLAGLAAGVYKNTQEIADKWQAGGIYKPCMNPQEREKRYTAWKKAVTRSFAQADQ